MKIKPAEIWQRARHFVLLCSMLCAFLCGFNPYKKLLEQIFFFVIQYNDQNWWVFFGCCLCCIVIKFQFQYMCEHSEKASFYSTGFGVWSQNFKFLCSWFFSFELFFSLSNLGMCYSVSEQKMWMESWGRIPKLLECEWEMDLFLLFHLSSQAIYFFHASCKSSSCSRKQRKIVTSSSLIFLYEHFVN